MNFIASAGALALPRDAQRLRAGGLAGALEEREHRPVEALRGLRPIRPHVVAGHDQAGVPPPKKPGRMSVPESEIEFGAMVLSSIILNSVVDFHLVGAHRDRRLGLVTGEELAVEGQVVGIRLAVGDFRPHANPVPPPVVSGVGGEVVPGPRGVRGRRGDAGLLQCRVSPVRRPWAMVGTPVTLPPNVTVCQTDAGTSALRSAAATTSCRRGSPGRSTPRCRRTRRG